MTGTHHFPRGSLLVGLLVRILDASLIQRMFLIFLRRAAISSARGSIARIDTHLVIVQEIQCRREEGAAARSLTLCSAYGVVLVDYNRNRLLNRWIKH